MRAPKRRRRNNQFQNGDMVNMVADLDEFAKFREEFLPMIRKDLQAGLDTKALRTKYQALLEARKLQIALMEPDSSKSLAAIRDIQDRHEGRAVERKAVAHRFEGLADKELDALLASKLEKVGLLESGDEPEND